VVITYHGVLPTADDRDHFLCGNFVACSAFEWQMARVRRYYTPVSLSQVVRALENGEPLPERALAVTFDDGFANNYRFAGPILRTYGIPATVFLATGHLDVPGAQLWTERVKRAVFLSTLERLPAVLPELAELPLGSDGQRADSARKVLGRMKRMPPADRDRALAELERVCGRPPLLEGDRDRYDFLTWEEVRRMDAAGIEFGSHTVSHPIMSTVDEAALAIEVGDSRRAIEDALQKPCLTFAYPNGGPGDFGPREQRALDRAGYRAAFKLFGGLNDTLSPPLALDRVNITRGFTPAMFDVLATGTLRLGKDLKALVGR
jgi:peptidoglycan/xylan/chitin deacetylase (PgdA/CDA1 family)